MEAWVKLTA